MGITMIFSMRGVRATGRPVSFFPKGALTYHLQSRRWYPSRWSDRALFPKRPPDTSPEGAGNAASGHRLCSQLYILICQQNDVAAYCRPIPPSACENLPLADLSQLCVCRITRHTHFLFKKRNRKNKNERTMKTKGYLSLGSKDYQPRCRTICCCGFCISELLQYSERLRWSAARLHPKERTCMERGISA